MKKRETLFIEGGFFSSQLLWSLIIFFEYSRKKKIKNIIFEKKDVRVLKNQIILKELKKFNIQFLEDILPFYLVNRFIMYIILLPKCIFLSFFFSKKKFDKKNWEKYQFHHSVFDTALSLSKDGTLFPKYKILLKSIFLNLKKKTIAKFLLKKNIHTIFSSHNVYSVKSFNSVFRKKNINVYCHAAGNIYKLPKDKDESWNNLNNKKLRNRLLKKLRLINVETYWKKKFLGKGDYFDSNLAFKKKKIFHNIKNLVMLHIFRDSPFISLDKKRIFFDYIDWINYTIKILKQSQETWFFKIHPNAKQWGENSNLIVNRLIKDNNAKNIKIISDGNIKNMINLKKVVTYSGSASYEAVSMGIKPIIISSNSLFNYDKNLTFKPKNLKEYKQLILLNNDKKFRVEKNKIINAKKMIFLNEKIMTLKKNLNSISIYRNEKNKKILDYRLINKSIKNNLRFLKRLGSLLSNGLTHTLSKEGIKLIN